MSNERLSISASIPMPIHIVIDDVGWRCGENGSARQEPFRTGIQRPHVPADYAAIARLGRLIGARPLAAMVLCDWDRTNLLRRVPTATWMGRAWDNSRQVGPWMEESADILRANREHVELGLHGVGHEYWDPADGGRFTRAEWHDANGNPRPPDEIAKHLDAFTEILLAHGLGPFPRSFVPCAFRHRFGSGFAGTLRARGVDMILTPFSSIFGLPSPRWGWFDVDEQSLTVDRTCEKVHWYQLAVEPSGSVEQPILGMHWPHVLHEDPSRNGEVVERWAQFLRTQGADPGKLIARDRDEFARQLIHHRCGQVREQGAAIELDLSASQAVPWPVKNSAWLKIVARKGATFTARGGRIQRHESYPHAGNWVHALEVEAQARVVRLQLEPSAP